MATAPKKIELSPNNYGKPMGIKMQPPQINVPERNVPDGWKWDSGVKRKKKVLPGGPQDEKGGTQTPPFDGGGPKLGVGRGIPGSNPRGGGRGGSAYDNSPDKWNASGRGGGGQAPWLQGKILPMDIGPGSANERAQTSLKNEWDKQQGGGMDRGGDIGFGEDPNKRYGNGQEPNFRDFKGQMGGGGRGIPGGPQGGGEGGPKMGGWNNQLREGTPEYGDWMRRTGGNQQGGVTPGSPQDMYQQEQAWRSQQGGGAPGGPQGGGVPQGQPPSGGRQPLQPGMRYSPRGGQRPIGGGPQGYPQDGSQTQFDISGNDPGRSQRVNEMYGVDSTGWYDEQGQLTDQGNQGWENYNRDNPNGGAQTGGGQSPGADQMSAWRRRLMEMQNAGPRNNQYYGGQQ